MADTTIPEPIDDMLRRETGDVVATSEVKERGVYQVYEGSRVPVSKRYGAIWKARLDSALSARTELANGWDESIRYYNNDQLSHREAHRGASGNARISKRTNRLHTETENLIFSGINSMIPAIYAKNPEGEYTAYDDEDKDMARLVERLTNALASMKFAPGFNAKPRLKQCIVLASLTNAGWIEIAYQDLEDSNEQVIGALTEAANRLADAKTEEEVHSAEGDLQALEDKFDVSRPEGPIMRVRSPRDIVVDPNSVEPDHMDAQWIMACDMLPTNYIAARYGKRKTKGGDTKVESAYKPTHILPVSSAGGVTDIEAQVNNFKLVKSEGLSPGDYGFQDKNDFDSAMMTKVWFVWDRTTRRVFMYHDEDWTWPLWVWDDPLGLPRFYPFFKLSFLTPPIGAHGKGEVTYVLDQQDAVNEIHDEWRRARQKMKWTVLYNSEVLSKQAVEAVLKGDDGTARGVSGVPEGTKISDHLWRPEPFVMQFGALFDPTPKMQAIDRVFGINEVLRGAQFKTNTTNQAINTYNSVSSMRLDDKIDSVEDFIGEILHNIAMLCVSKMSQQQVENVIGSKNATAWKQMSPSQFAAQFNLRVVGGSTLKPTSATKKQEALQAGQVLGQFAKATPVALTLFIRILQNAFDNFTIKSEDWDELLAALPTNSGAQPGGPAAPGAPPGAVPPSGPSAPGGDMMQQLAAMLDQLPPQLRAALGQLLQQGMPAAQALQTMSQVMQNSQGK